jgi:hypothetical protein
MSSSYPITALPWWRDLAQRLWRQGQQTLVPILLLASTSGTVDLKAVGYGIAAAEVVTVVKFGVTTLADWRPTPDTNWLGHAADRVLPAVGAVLATVPVASLADIEHANYTQLGSAALLAAVLSLVDTGVNPAALGNASVPPADPATQGPAW